MEVPSKNKEIRWISARKRSTKPEIQVQTGYNQTSLDPAKNLLEALRSSLRAEDEPQTGRRQRLDLNITLIPSLRVLESEN